jgi:hypothetical protein
MRQQLLAQRRALQPQARHLRAEQALALLQQNLDLHAFGTLAAAAPPRPVCIGLLTIEQTEISRIKSRADQFHAHSSRAQIHWLPDKIGEQERATAASY